MTHGGGRMSHRKHRLVRGRTSRIGGLIDTARILNKNHDEQVAQAVLRKTRQFDSVKEAFESEKKKRR